MQFGLGCHPIEHDLLICLAHGLLAHRLLTNDSQKMVGEALIARENGAALKIGRVFYVPIGRHLCEQHGVGHHLQEGFAPLDGVLNKQISADDFVRQLQIALMDRASVDDGDNRIGRRRLAKCRCSGAEHDGQPDGS